MSSSYSLTPAELDNFKKNSFLGPYDLIKSEELPAFIKKCKKFPSHVAPWEKSVHALMPEMLEIATRPQLLDKVKSILGNDVILWGSQIIVKKPSLKHEWHVDVETMNWGGLTCWVPLENAFKSISVITGSHDFKVSPQELHKKGILNYFNDGEVLREAKKLNPDSEIIVPEIMPGQVVMWDGPNWHSAINNTNKIRVVMIMQFSTPDKLIRQPKNFDYPNTKFFDKPVPCVLASGQDNYKINYMIKKEDSGSLKLWLKYRFLSLFKFYHTKNILRPLYRKFFPLNTER